MKSSKAVLIVASVILALSMISIAGAVTPTFICDPGTSTQCAAVNSAGYLNVLIQGNSSTKLLDSAGTNKAAINSSGELRVSQGGDSTWPAIGTAPANVSGSTNCTVLSTPAIHRVSTLVVESATQQTAGTDLILYDTTSTSQCDANHEFYHTGQIGAGGSFPVNWPISNGGIAYRFMGTWVGDGFRISGN